MTSRVNGMLNISVNDVARWGEHQEFGVIKEIRIIDTAKFVEKFSGEKDEVMLKIRTTMGTVFIWPKEHEIIKAADHEAKEFKLKLKQHEE